MKAAFSPADAEVLRRQTINENQPGSILRDFEIFLDFVRDRELKASGVNQLLPMNSLGELNALLAKPLDIRLKRPQQKSYSNINGLFLLGRASGLLGLQNRENEKIFILEADALSAWRELNATERYFTLLEAWIVRGSLEMLGEWQGGGIYNDTLYNLARLFEKIPAEGLQIEGNPEFRDYGLSFYGLHNIALAEMFGWLEIENGAGQTGRSRIIEKIRRTDFGRAVVGQLLLTLEALDFDWQNEEFFGEQDRLAFDILKPSFATYFPEWRACFRLSQAETVAGIYVFKVSLGKKTWRRIAVSSEDLLDHLSDAILNAFRFDHDHLYEFSYLNRFGVRERIGHPALDEAPSTDEFTIGELPLREGETMEYLYDFGDSWRFAVELEKIEPQSAKLKTPRILETHGKAPPQYPDWGD
jgi:hypothetical protein